MSPEIKIYPDGNQICAIIGEMPESDLVGFGTDDEEALAALGEAVVTQISDLKAQLAACQRGRETDQHLWQKVLTGKDARIAELQGRDKQLEEILNKISESVKYYAVASSERTQFALDTAETFIDENETQFARIAKLEAKNSELRHQLIEDHIVGAHYMEQAKAWKAKAVEVQAAIIYYTYNSTLKTWEDYPEEPCQRRSKKSYREQASRELEEEMSQKH